MTAATDAVAVLPVMVKSAASTPVTTSLNVTRQVRLSALVGEVEGVCRTMDVTVGAVLSLVADGVAVVLAALPAPAPFTPRTWKRWFTSLVRPVTTWLVSSERSPSSSLSGTSLHSVKLPPVAQDRYWYLLAAAKPVLSAVTVQLSVTWPSPGVAVNGAGACSRDTVALLAEARLFPLLAASVATPDAITRDVTMLSSVGVIVAV